MELRALLTCLLLSLYLRAGGAQDTDVVSVLNCCEGDVLFLLDSSGSVSSFDFSHMLSFLSDLTAPFSLGPDQVRMGLLQVGTEPHLEFGFGAYSSQQGLQAALQRTKQLGGDTNTEDALVIAKERVLRQGTPGGARQGLPRVLVWLTDGIEPGDVEGPMAELREDGVAVLVVSTGRGNYQILREVVSPPAEEHLYFVDIEDMNIITEDVRNAIIEIIRAERLQVRDVTTTTAELHWRPVLAGTGNYDIRFGPVRTEIGGPDGGPESNLEFFNKLNATFTTRPNETIVELQSPAQLTVSDSTINSVRVSWGPLLPESVENYTIEYSILPSGKVHVVTVGNRQNSTVLTNLQPATQYLVTVSAHYFMGKERAISAKMCTQDVLPPLADLELRTVGSDSVKLQWKGSADGLRGYWVTWEGEPTHSSSQRSTLYLPPHLVSTTLNHVPHNSRVCVSPVYRSARGEGLCCTASFSSANVPWIRRS
ncbi:von Willebrand factor A domain-containing protein 1 isoform X2 [Astyanax mexicanus]|uniref:von Willebrand factor A domain-containing protein 1 isoform X2 n=1 Tax=Astyanax mexicanus TaxID=7994 RepID=UPI0020CAC9D1|nr:von Willebrand factor A domain-containing protein 1 isoform X2 [Astyanax mexicanus]